MFLPVDDDGCDLLVHKDENGAEQSRDGGDNCGPPGVGPHRVDNPATIIPGWLRVMAKRTFKKIIIMKNLKHFNKSKYIFPLYF